MPRRSLSPLLTPSPSPSPVKGEEIRGKGDGIHQIASASPRNDKWEGCVPHRDRREGESMRAKRMPSVAISCWRAHSGIPRTLSYLVLIGIDR